MKFLDFQISVSPFALVLLLSGVYSGLAQAQQSNSDYLKSLEGEASDLTLDGKTTTRTPAPSTSDASVTKQWETNTSGGIVELVPGLDQAQFESVLKNNYIGSHLFYRGLTEAQKKEVFSFYQTNADAKAVREKILQIKKQ